MRKMGLPVLGGITLIINFWAVAIFLKDAATAQNYGGDDKH